MVVTDIYKKVDEGDHVKMSAEEVESELARAKRILTDESDGAVLTFEKKPLDPLEEDKFGIKGVTYAGGMDRIEILMGVMKVLEIPFDELPSIVAEMKLQHDGPVQS